ncbi:MAG TPA: carboxypeptidase-like regulatory domain-containing protein, partial [Verrucomicrobiae bacterium]|nr:carboxypeptidase-like regulatory domain-containing protein [Verrucomicrobiae bacterium]
MNIFTPPPARRAVLAVWLLACGLTLLATAAAQAVFRGQIVSSASGIPVENAHVSLDRNPPDSKADYQADTDSFGFFSLTNVAAGDFKLAVDHHSFLPYSTNFTMGTAATNKVIKLVPIDGKVVFDIYVQVWCLATHAELVGSTVKIEYWAPGSNLGGAPDNVFPMVAGPGGTVTASNMEDGFYRFTISQPGWQTLNYLPDPKSGDFVVAGDKVRLIRSLLATAFLKPNRTGLTVNVTGYDPVKDKPNLPLKEMVVKLTGVALDDDTKVLVPTISVLTDANGAFSFKNLPPIHWKISAGRLGYLPQEVTVAPNANGAFAPVNFQMQLAPTKVKVILSSLYQTNAAVSGATVQLKGLLNASTEGIDRQLKTTGDASGNTASVVFENLLPGNYWIGVTHQTTISGLPFKSGVLFFNQNAFSVS